MTRIAVLLGSKLLAYLSCESSALGLLEDATLPGPYDPSEG